MLNYTANLAYSYHKHALFSPQIYSELISLDGVGSIQHFQSSRHVFPAQKSQANINGRVDRGVSVQSGLEKVHVGASAKDIEPFVQLACLGHDTCTKQIPIEPCQT